jgi:U4/U6 small nuclear ribonucleoprotein PRP31
MVVAERTKLLGTNHKRMAKRGFAGTASTTNGLQTSLAFTPVQRFELMNLAAAAARVKAANKKYFESNSGFLSVKPE